MYLSTPTKIAIIDHEKKRTYVLRKEGMPDAVVWNPWDKKAKALPDLGNEDYKTMLCVDSAAIETAIILKPFEEWKGRQELSTVSSSYCSGQLDPPLTCLVGELENEIKANRIRVGADHCFDPRLIRQLRQIAWV
ncbi:aldose 1-epimerase family protein [Forsythia ovata]|uniref:Aldose 1-epimerase family protein n=1 Tax=Forsythia ovata TaxID=205694 RepID=A0ABD1X9D3_9LAMI